MTTKPTTKIVTWNDFDIASEGKARRKKTWLENKGYTLKNTVVLPSGKYKLTYILN